MPEQGVQAALDVEEQEWQVIPHEENTPRNIRFRAATRRVIKLLRLRKIFSRAGSYLNTAASRQAQNARIRRTMTEIFTSWPRTILKGTKVIFDHLERRRGELVYRR